jgi:hypothetical protein
MASGTLPGAGSPTRAMAGSCAPAGYEVIGPAGALAPNGAPAAACWQ